MPLVLALTSAAGLGAILVAALTASPLPRGGGREGSPHWGDRKGRTPDARRWTEETDSCARVTCAHCQGEGRRTLFRSRGAALGTEGRRRALQ